MLSIIMAFYFACGKQRAVAARGKIERLLFVFYNAVNNGQGPRLKAVAPVLLFAFTEKNPRQSRGEQKSFRFERRGKRTATLRLKAVSYTHLDVYKRQASGRLV